MTYNYNRKTNKARLFIYAGIAGFVALCVALFVFAPKPLALVCTAAGAFMVRGIVKEIARVQSARVITYTEGFTVYTSHGDKIEFTWQEVTHAGVVTAGSCVGTVFAYAEESDKIVQLPPVFCNFDALTAELSANTPWQEYALTAEETITDRLKKILGIAPKE